MSTPTDHLHKRTEPAVSVIADADELAAADTGGLDLDLPPLTEAHSVLHHSCRGTAVPARIALPGQYLGFADEEGDEQLIPLTENLIHLGRSHTAAIRLEDIRVSRRHAIIARCAGQVRVLDDASTWGTFVNGRSVIAANVADGDIIRLGPVALRYVVVR